MKDHKEIVDITKSTLPTLSSRAMFWRPKYLSESEYLEHIPFYFWLAEAQQTRLVFEPDLMSGSSYFAICQAVDKLNLDSRCVALINESCIERGKIEEYNHDNYREFSEFLTDTPQDALYDFEDQTIDTLVLRHDSELVRDKALMDRWLAKLSDEAVVLLHGSKQKDIKPLSRKLKESYPTFEFGHGGGLLVVCYGGNQSSKVLSLVSHKANDSGSRVIQNIYRRLGSACMESWFNSISKKKISSLSEKIKSKSLELNEKVDLLARSKGQVEKLESYVLDLNKKSLSSEKEIERLSDINKAGVESAGHLMQEIGLLKQKLAEADFGRQVAEKELTKLELENAEIKEKLSNQECQRESEKTLNLLQVQQLQQELECVFSEKQGVQNKLSNKKSHYESDKALLLLQVQQLQEELEGAFFEKQGIQNKLSIQESQYNSEKALLSLQVQQLQEEVEVIYSENRAVENKLSSQERKFEFEIALLMLQVQQLQQELEIEFSKRTGLEAELGQSKEAIGKLSSELKCVNAELNAHKAKSTKVGEEIVLKLRTENELAILQNQQLQEELETYFNKYQSLVQEKGFILGEEFNEARLERSLMLKRLSVS